MLLYRIIALFFFIFPIFADVKVHLYYYRLPFLTNQMIHQPMIRKKYRDSFLHFYEIHKFYSKEETAFFYIHFPTEISFLQNQNQLKEYIEFYLYVLKNYQFDGISFLSLNSGLINQDILSIIDQIKPFRDKIVCFDCLESFSYLYKRNISHYFQKIKMMNMFFKNCKIYDESLKKFFYIEEDTNLWTLYINRNCLKDEVIEQLKRQDKKTFILFLEGNNEFYKIFKNASIYICHTDSNYFCKISIVFREGNIISVEQNFINLF